MDMLAEAYYIKLLTNGLYY